MNKKIDDKLDSMAINIESRIYNNFLKPSISTIEKTMRTNFEEIKSKIKTIDIESSTVTYECEPEFRPKKNLLRETHETRETEREKKLNTKLDAINNLGGKLYDKLVEKVFIN